MCECAKGRTELQSEVRRESRERSLTPRLWDDSGRQRTVLTTKQCGLFGMGEACNSCFNS